MWMKNTPLPLSVAFIHGMQGDHPRYLKAAAGVNHFTYFERPRSATCLVDGLLRPARADRAGFEPLEPPGE